MWYRAYDGELVNLNHVQSICVVRMNRAPYSIGDEGTVVYQIQAEHHQVVDGLPAYTILEMCVSIETAETAMAKIAQFLKIESQLLDRPEKKPDRIPVRAL